MSTPPAFRMAAAWLAALLAAACEESPVTSQPVAQLSVAPSRAVLPGPGGTVDFDVVALDPTGAEVAGLEVAWSSSDDAIASVDADGVATALRVGFVAVRAEAAGRTGAAVLAVDPDTLPPTLVDVSVDEERVGVQNAVGEVTLSVRLADDRAGVSSALAVFGSPAGAQATGLIPLSRVEGGSLDGRWAGPLTIPANTGVGTWRLILVEAEDRHGNVARWNERDLEALGLTVSFEVRWTPS